MQAIILAAGISSRFYPYNFLGHKSLVTLGGKMLLGRTLKSLKRAGVTDAVIIEDVYETVSTKLTEEDLRGLKVRFVIQEKPTGMGDALLCASKYLENSFFVLSAYHFEADMFVKEMLSAKKNETDLVLLTQNVSDIAGFGAVIKKDGKIKISEKKETGEAQKVLGMYLLNREFIRVLNLENKEHYSFENALSSYSENYVLVALEARAETLSLKYPWDLLNAKNFFLKTIKRKISKSANVSSKAVIKGNVFIDEGATIMDGAVITGPCYIGKNSYVGTNSILRSGVCIEEGAVVGAQMEIKNTLIMKGATTHSGFIGDSVIGEKTKIAAGFNSGNVRLDRKEVQVAVKGEKINSHIKSLGVFVGNNCSFGIKVGTMPGVIVGNNVVIGPGTTIMENVEDNVTYYTQIKGIIKKKNL